MSVNYVDGKIDHDVYDKNSVGVGTTKEKEKNL